MFDEKLARISSLYQKIMTLPNAVLYRDDCKDVPMMNMYLDDVADRLERAYTYLKDCKEPGDEKANRCFVEVVLAIASMGILYKKIDEMNNGEKEGEK